MAPICAACKEGKHCYGKELGDCVCLCANIDDIIDDGFQFYESAPGWGEPG